MDPKTLGDHLADYYGAQELSPRTAKHLAHLADVVHETSRRRSGPSSRMVGYGVAACLGLLGVSVVLQIVALTQSPQVVLVDRNASVAAEGSTAWESAREKRLVAASQSDPRFVAVKFHMDGCPYSAETAPVFTELMQKYSAEPIVFAQYDMTTKDSLARSANLARGLGVDGLCKGPYQSGLIELLDRRSGEVIARLDRREDFPSFEKALNQALR